MILIDDKITGVTNITVVSTLFALSSRIFSSSKPNLLFRLFSEFFISNIIFFSFRNSSLFFYLVSIYSKIPNCKCHCCLLSTLIVIGHANLQEEYKDVFFLPKFMGHLDLQIVILGDDYRIFLLASLLFSVFLP